MQGKGVRGVGGDSEGMGIEGGDAQGSSPYGFGKGDGDGDGDGVKVGVIVRVLGLRSLCLVGRGEPYNTLIPLPELPCVPNCS